MLPETGSALTEQGKTETVNTISQLYRSLAERFAEMVRQDLGARLTSIVLYGSVARGTARPDSDIDLFVVAGESDEDKGPLWDQVLDLEQTFWNDQEVAALRAQGYRASIETYVVSKAQAWRGLPIYLDMTLDAIVLHDPEKFFSRRIDQVKQRMVELRSRREWLSKDTYIWQLKTDAEPGEVISLPYVEETQR
ncbi:MAG: nucleotidyltransferase domain-containing protein [Chloroflexota bacterium]